MSFKWKEALKKAEAMQSERRLTLSTQLFDWVVLLNQIFDDPGFRRDIGVQVYDDIGAGDWLNRYVEEDTGLTFLKLRAVLTRFPKQEQWVEHRSPHRMFEIIEEEREAARRATPKPVRKTATVAEVEDLRHKVQHVEAKANNQVAKAKAEAEAKVAEAKQEVVEVRRQAEEKVEAAKLKVVQVKSEVERLREELAAERERRRAVEQENRDLKAKIAKLEKALAKHDGKSNGKAA